MPAQGNHIGLPLQAHFQYETQQRWVWIDTRRWRGGTKLFQNEVFRNKYVWAAIILCAGLLISAVYLPIVSAALKLRWHGHLGRVFTGWKPVPLIDCLNGQDHLKPDLRY